MATRRELLTRLTAALEPLYPHREAALIARMALAERGGISESALLIEPHEELTISDYETLEQELVQGRPIQYVLGWADFCGLRFRVREGCLIPRPETEELVAHIVEQSPTAQRILDVGTGSGCIALALKHALPAARVEALDFSPEALMIARENGDELGLEVDFRMGDALQLEASVVGPYEVIVSNPPYIPWREKGAMRRNVTHYEPHEALFVSDDDPLCFYRAIARASLVLLAPQGSLWFEIHENYAHEMVEMLREMGYTQVELLYDINDKPRMTWSRR